MFREGVERTVTARTSSSKRVILGFPEVLNGEVPKDGNRGSLFKIGVLSENCGSSRSVIFFFSNI